jgi:hypothetical protein
MSLIRNRRGFLGVLFPALLAFVLIGPGAATAQETKQIKLTEKHIQGFMASYEDMAKLFESANPDNPDPKVEAQAAVIANTSVQPASTLTVGTSRTKLATIKAGRTNHDERETGRRVAGDVSHSATLESCLGERD